MGAGFLLNNMQTDGFTSGGQAQSPMQLKKVKLIQGVVVKGHPGVVQGSTIEADPRTAHELVTSGWAVYVTEIPVEQREEVQTREPIIQQRDPQTQPSQSAKRTRPK